MKCSLCGEDVGANDRGPAIKIRGFATYSDWATQQGEPESRTKHFWCSKHYNSFMSWAIREREQHGKPVGDISAAEGD